MKQTKLSRSLLCLILAMLLAAAALTLTGCTSNPTGGSATEGDLGQESATETDLAPEQSDAQISVGEGEKTFYFEVTSKDGVTSSFAVHTDADTVGEALVENQLIEGTDSDYGLYVTTVNGETLDWDADGMYWAFYENGEYAATGVDSTVVIEGRTYAFTATAG